MMYDVNDDCFLTSAKTNHFLALPTLESWITKHNLHLCLLMLSQDYMSLVFIAWFKYK